jgi:hypothetical protein
MSQIEQQQAAQLAAQQQQLQQQQHIIDQANARAAAAEQRAVQLQAAASSSPPSSSSSSPPVARAPDMQPLRPNPFSGQTGHNAEQWLTELERYFTASRCIKDQSSVVLASTYLKDSASVWFTAKYPNIMDCPKTWDEFKAIFLERFRPFAAARTARSALRNLRHRGNVTGYSDAFLKCVQHIPEMHETDQIDAYINGLQAHIAEEIDRADPATLSEAINLAQREELRQASRRGQKSTFYSADRRNFTPSIRDRSHPPSSQHHSFPASDSNRMDLSHIRHSSLPSDQINSSSSFAPVSQPPAAAVAAQVQAYYNSADMQHAYEEGLNAIHQRPSAPYRKQAQNTRVPNLSQADYDRCSKAGLCFCCGQPGHLSRNCPKNPRASSRPLNY